MAKRVAKESCQGMMSGDEDSRPRKQSRIDEGEECANDTHLEPVKLQLSIVDKAVRGLNMTADEITTKRAVIEADIQRKIRQLHEALEVRKTELIGQLDQMTQQMLKTLSIQRDELEMTATRLNSCLQNVGDSLKTGGKGEILVMEAVLQQVKEMCAEFDPEKLPPREPAYMALIDSSELLPACQQFGYISQVCPEKCYATGKGLETATVCEQSTVTMHAIDREGRRCAAPLPDTSISCELVSCSTSERVKCTIIPVKTSEYNIDYQPTLRGRHQLHITISDHHIRDSPFTVVAIRTITGLRSPWGVAISERGQIIIAEWGGHGISIYNPNGEKVKSFGQQGSAPGQFNHPCGVAVDRAGNILVVDGWNNRIQQFSGDGKFMGLVGSEGSRPGQFHRPVGIGISPSGKVCICDRCNHRVQILNPDLTFSSSFGSEGSGDGQFKWPCGVAFDSHGNVYITDDNNRIQIFTEDGCFLRKFGKKGRGDGKLNFPTGVAIDSDDVMHVVDSHNHRISLFTSEGHFLRSFGTKGDGPDDLCGVAIDRNAVVYVSDLYNDRLQVF